MLRVCFTSIQGYSRARVEAHAADTYRRVSAAIARARCGGGTKGFEELKQARGNHKMGIMAGLQCVSLSVLHTQLSISLVW